MWILNGDIFFFLYSNIGYNAIEKGNEHKIYYNLINRYEILNISFSEIYLLLLTISSEIYFRKNSSSISVYFHLFYLYKYSLFNNLPTITH
jgi:hypothetical protein